MARVTIDRDSHIALIEDAWWEGYMEGRQVEVHAKVYRCDMGENRGRFSANAHLHSKGGGHLTMYAGMPDPSKLAWSESREAAVDAALTKLEAREDLKLP